MKKVFWETQPLNSVEQEKKEKEKINLPKGFEFKTFDVEKDIDELFKLIAENYVEDPSSRYKIFYSKDFLAWNIKQAKEKEFALKLEYEGEMVAFVLAVDHLIFQKKLDKKTEIVGINFLCIEKRFRKKGLAPVIIRKITEICNSKGIYSSIFTAGTKLPKIYKSASYYHSTFQKDGLVIDDNPRKGTRKAEKKDIPQILELYNEKCEGLELFEILTEERIEKRFFCENCPLKIFVHEINGKIEEFVSFYNIYNEDTYLKRQEFSNYIYLYHSESSNIINDAKKIFNKEIGVSNSITCLEIMGIDKMIEKSEFHFAKGTGRLNYYLFNLENVEIGLDKMGFILF